MKALLPCMILIQQHRKYLLQVDWASFSINIHFVGQFWRKWFTQFCECERKAFHFGVFRLTILRFQLATDILWEVPVFTSWPSSNRKHVSPEPRERSQAQCQRKFDFLKWGCSRQKKDVTWLTSLFPMNAFASRVVSCFNCSQRFELWNLRGLYKSCSKKDWIQKWIPADTSKNYNYATFLAVFNVWRLEPLQLSVSVPDRGDQGESIKSFNLSTRVEQPMIKMQSNFQKIVFSPPKKVWLYRTHQISKYQITNPFWLNVGGKVDLCQTLDNPG